MKIYALWRVMAGRIRGDKAAAGALVLLVSVALTLVGLAMLCGYNLYGWAMSMRQTARLAFYLNDTISPVRLSQIRTRLAKDPEIAALTYISKKDALELYKRGGGDVSLLTRFGENPLPASFEVQLVRSDRAETLIEKYAQVKGVEEVESLSPEWLSHIEDVLRRIRLWGGGIGGGLVVMTYVVISGAMRFRFRAWQEEVAMLRLMGATHTLIYLPFLLEGVMIGLIGGGSAVAILLMAFDASVPAVALFLSPVLGPWSLNFLPVQMRYGLVLFGVSVCGLAGLLTPAFVKKGNV